jgi:ribosome biogenesis GTPase
MPDSDRQAKRWGTVVAAFGRRYEVELTDGSITTGFPPGKKSLYVCGDELELTPDGQIARHAERYSLLYRSDMWRQKLIAANVTQIVLVVATEPSFSDLLLTRALVAAEHQGIRPLIVLNKSDLATNLAAAHDLLKPFAEIGYRILEISAMQNIDPLIEALTNQRSIFVGQSGMGKSTLTNALVPGAAAATREVSTALDTGKHTTTHARLYRLPFDPSGQSTLIDSPGLQEFGLNHLTPKDIAQGFAEFRHLLDTCRFRDCLHMAEPDCAIKAAAERGMVHPRRMEHYTKLIEENQSQQHKE